MNSLTFSHSDAKPIYIAVSEFGFGIDEQPAVAIWRALEQVPFDSKPAQLLLYRSADEVKPTGFKNGGPVWPNGQQPKLCGLTTTHQAWTGRPRI
jgi:hypothetical protein